MASHLRRDSATILNGERMLSVRETAKIMGWCLDSVRRHLRAGDMPGVRVGRNWRIPESHLVAYLRESGNKIEPYAPKPKTESAVPLLSRETGSGQGEVELSEVLEAVLRTPVARTYLLDLMHSAMKNTDATREVSQQILHEVEETLSKLG